MFEAVEQEIEMFKSGLHLASNSYDNNSLIYASQSEILETIVHTMLELTKRSNTKNQGSFLPSHESQ